MVSMFIRLKKGLVSDIDNYRDEMQGINPNRQISRADAVRDIVIKYLISRTQRIKPVQRSEEHS